jgi:hypothetical protein
MRKLLLGLTIASAQLIWTVASAQQISMPVPGALDAAGRKVLTFIAKDPPGQRCNGNLQVAAELANVYRVPIQLLPSSLAPGLPAPAVFFGNQLIAADGRDHNGQASFQMVADVLEVEGVAKQDKTGLLYNDKVRKDFEALRSAIKAGGK